MNQSKTLTFFSDTGSITCRGGYNRAVAKLCALEDMHGPEERYTVRPKDRAPFPRRGIELVLGRLYDYEHSGGGAI